MSNSVEALQKELAEVTRRLRVLEDTEAVKRLQAEYVYVIDTFQMEKLPDLFAEDFVLDFTGCGVTVLVKSRDELKKMHDAVPSYYSMMEHITSTPRIEVNGDAAKGTWYLFGPLTRRTAKGPVAILESGRYDVDYVRERGVWKIKRLGFVFTMHTPFEDGWVKTPIGALDVDV